MMNNGLLLVKLPRPRMLMVALEPGCPLLVIFTPEVSPRMASTTLPETRSAKASSFTVEMEPSRSFFLTEP